MWIGSAAYRKQFIAQEGIRFTEGCIYGEDLEFIYKALSRAVEVVRVDRVLSYYVLRSGSATRSGHYNVRIFDAVEALERVCHYLRSQNDESFTSYGLYTRV